MTTVCLFINPFKIIITTVRDNDTLQQTTLKESKLGIPDHRKGGHNTKIHRC